MPLISPEDRQALETLFAQELQDDVTITYFTQRESVLIIPGQECCLKPSSMTAWNLLEHYQSHVSSRRS